MNILFLTFSQFIRDLSKRGIYTDLMRKFAREGHNIFIVCPLERRLKQNTNLSINGNVQTLGVKTLNITKSNFLEKGVGVILVEYQFKHAIKKYFADIDFDLVLYSTPPITFSKIISFVKKKKGAKSYLLLKDIFPQGAVDLGVLSKKSLFYSYFRKKEKELYMLSDYIGCMSPANVKYILEHNPDVRKDRVEVCPNSIEPRKNTEVVDRKEIFSKYNIPEDKVILLYGGNLGKPQGVDFLIEVLDSNASNSEIFFLIAGSGTEYNKLKNWIINKQPSNVLLLPAIPVDDYERIVQLSDVGLIFLDRRFTIPNYPSRLLSYLENKIPVLMAIDRNTDVGKIAEENGYGLWSESGDLNAFNKNLNHLVSNKELRLKMGEKGYQYLIKNYTVDNSYRIIMSHFR